MIRFILVACAALAALSFNPSFAGASAPCDGCKKCECKKCECKDCKCKDCQGKDCQGKECGAASADARV